MAKFDSNLSQVVDLDQGGSSAYSPLNPAAPSTAASKAVSWTMQWKDNSSTENVVPPNYSYHHTQQPVPLVRDVQDGEKAAKQSVTSSSLGSTHGSQEQAGLSSYSSPTDAYGYDNTGYQGYYYGYQQQASNAYSQQVGTYQNSGAPYQPLTSFQNSGTYSGSTSYSSTYYNTADYQTSGGYPSTSSSNQTTQWSDGNYASYPSHQYPNYTTLDSNAAHSSTSVASAPLSYEQQYKQWADYYSHTASASDVTCAPGTENVSATSASSQNTQIPGVSGAYPLSDSQPPPPGTTSWRQEPSSSDFPPLQACVPTGSGETYNGYWADGTSGYHHSSQTTSFSQAPSYTQIPSYTHTPSYSQTLSYTQATPSYSQIPSYAQTPPYSQTSSHSPAPSYFQKSLDSNPAPHETQDLQKTAFPLGPNSQYSTVQQISQNYHSPMQSVSTFDAHRVKVQIPTNPRIASNLAVGLPKTEKDISTTEAVTKPAYVSVSMAKLDNVSSHDAADSMLKPGAFPASLRAYVERALARCKNDLQKAACQTIMKEIITNASADGTLFTRNWDIEPLFQLPDLDARNKNSSQDASILSSLPKYKKSPGRRTKSRWEPLSEEKLASVNQVSVKDISWDRVKEREKAVSGGRFGNKEDGWSSAKFLQAQLQNQSKTPQRPFKKPRVGDVNSVTENGDASSDSEKEQGLTAYCSGGLALGNSPEERKRRENRSKRFEKGPGQRTEGKPLRPKVVGGGSLYTKRASALALGRDHEDGGSRAVEDIDWDSLTVKGTCQEIEKRYLRLTSAPDPATVRPEEVLEKALNMVLSSKKNYLYKCDQLKSLRQDLTVQRIRNELTVKVYETHARLALEAGDLPEYNQCQSQLKILYAEGIKGCHMEFSAYNLLCVILHSNNSRDLVASMARLSGEAKNDEAVKHALAVRAAVTSGNYVSFFRLYRTAPNLNTCLMDLHVERMRFEAVKCMSRSYRPAVPIAFIAQVLGFMGPTSTTEGYDEKDKDALEECGEWLKAHGASLTVDSSGDAQLDTKASSSSLFMPEPEDAVAHGDANLAVNDFFTRTA